MKHTEFFKILLVLLIMFFPAYELASAQDQLKFRNDNFTVRTRTISTARGERAVTFRCYLHLPYVAIPVDKDFQSLNVYVPIKIDGTDIDASHAPILFDIGAGGYVSVNNAKSNETSYRADLALAAGYVVVSPGCRGRDNRFPDGRYYGKVPAAIVDLKAAVCCLRYNKNLIPGNTDWMVVDNQTTLGNSGLTQAS